MQTVRDRSELGAAVRAGEGTIEARGPLAAQVARSRLAALVACATAGVATGMIAVGTVAASVGDAAKSLPTMPAAGAMLALVMMLGSLTIAFQSGGMTALVALWRYRQAHRSYGVLVLRRR